jgi:hypothetical protein
MFFTMGTGSFRSLQGSLKSYKRDHFSLFYEQSLTARAIDSSRATHHKQKKLVFSKVLKAIYWKDNYDHRIKEEVRRICLENDWESKQLQKGIVPFPHILTMYLG